MSNSARFKTIMLTVSLLALALAGPAAAQNILNNGDFETGDFTGWEVFGVSGSSTPSVLGGDNGPTLPGSSYAFLDNQAAALALGIKQVTPVGSAAAGDVAYSFDLKLDQADAGGVVFVEIFAEADGAGIVGGSGLLGPYFPFAGWETFAGTFPAPAGTDYLVIQVTAITGADPASNCLLRVDNVSLEQPGVVSNEDTSWGEVKALFN